MSSSYVPLHLHTQYSLLDGAIRLEELIAKALKYNLKALAMTDHGNIFGAIEFYKKVRNAGLKPIIGCEVYVAPKGRFEKKHADDVSEASFHLILLCKDIQGYKNLTKLISNAYLEGFYYRPRIDKELLSEHSRGLIGLSSCLKGEVPYYLSRGMPERAREAALGYKQIFGEENFFFEIQANEIPEQDAVNQQLIELSRELNIPLAATNDCHYLEKSDAKAHDVLLCIQTGKTLNDTDRMRFSGEGCYFKSPEEMKEIFRHVPEAVENTKRIADRCNLDFKFGVFHLPEYNVPEGYDSNSYLRKLVEEGVRKKFSEGLPENYMERLEHELKIIEAMGFSSYFLIVWDFISYAKNKGIPVGPGRGSAAGSLVAYCLDIVEIDPLRYGLLFERFLNPERISMPDIDVDFCMNRRAEVLEYVAERYGKDHVAQIITFGTMQARAVIRDVGRAMNIPYAEVDRVAKLVPAIAKITLEEAVKREPKLEEIYDNSSEIKELIDVAKRLEGLSRHASTHAAGVVISPEPLTEFLPLYKAPNEPAITTQYDMESIETLGLLKFDFLGLKTLTVIDETEKIINKTHPSSLNLQPFSIRNIPLDDKPTYELLCSGRTTGIFQLESSGMRDILKRMRPGKMEDLIALVALYRPGPMDWIDEFIKRRSGEGKFNYELPQLKEILEETYGIVLYQEQVMMIANKIANFTMGQADTLRKAMGKKLAAEMEKQKEIFVDGAVANKISEKKAIKLFEYMEPFAKYGFNKSHSAAYGLIAYQTAYLKANYPVEFMAATLSSDMDNTAKIVSYISECKEMGIKVLPPDINEGGREFMITGHSIRFGLEAVKGVGGSAIEAIIEARSEKSFTSFIDFCSRCDSKRVNKKVIESLIKAGAMDSMGKRAQMMSAVNSVMDIAVRDQRGRASGQASMFELHPTSPAELPDVEEWQEPELLAMEKEALGFYITGHPLNRYEEKLREFSVTPTHELQELQDKEDVTVGGILRSVKLIQTKRTKDLMAYFIIEDLYGTAELIVFPDLYRDCTGIISEDTPVLINGYLDKSDKGLKVIAKKIVPIDRSEELKEYKAQVHEKHSVNEQWVNGQRPIGSQSASYRRAAKDYGQPAPVIRQKTLTLTLYANTGADNLTRLKDVFSKYSGDCQVYFKIIAPRQWETLIMTGLSVAPSQGAISEIENLLGEGTAVLS
ncbi:MAG: DNA polymerase III subunit alpha [Nitrospirae bacterium]|nr:DNA polymerase III subunit alpha [Nitrospirota bacterium]